MRWLSTILSLILLLISPTLVFAVIEKVDENRLKIITTYEQVLPFESLLERRKAISDRLIKLQEALTDIDAQIQDAKDKGVNEKKIIIDEIVDVGVKVNLDPANVKPN